MKKKTVYLILGIVVLIIIAIVIYNYLNNKNKDSNKIIETNEEIAEVSSQTITTTLTAPGEVQSAQTEKLTLNNSYYYLTMCAEKNEFVKKGDNLLKYSNGKYLTAPYDLVITDYSVPTVKEKCTTSNYIAVSSVEDLYMDINIGEDKIEKVISGQEVDIVVNYDETKEYKGTISKINAIGTKGNGATNFAAIASLKNDGNLKIGMSATCTITIDKIENLPCLPIEAIEVEDDKKYVNLINSDETISRVEVETGVADANYVQITKGLSLGNKVKFEKRTVTLKETEDETTTNPFASMFNMGGDKGERRNKGGF